MKTRTVNLKPGQNILSGNYLPEEIVMVKCDASVESFTVQVQDATTIKDVVFYLKKTDSSSNTITFNFVTGQTADGATTLTLSTQNDIVGILSDNDNYQVITSLNIPYNPLTADWDAGSFKITAEQFESDIITGTAPFPCASTTLNPNLNAGLVDGYHHDQSLLQAATPQFASLGIGTPAISYRGVQLGFATDTIESPMGFGGTVTWTPSGNANNTMYGLNFSSVLAGTYNVQGLYGIYSKQDITGSGTVSTVRQLFLDCRVTNTTRTVSGDLRGIETNYTKTGSNVVLAGNAYQLYLADYRTCFTVSGTKYGIRQIGNLENHLDYHIYLPDNISYYCGNGKDARMRYSGTNMQFRIETTGEFEFVNGSVYIGSGESYYVNNIKVLGGQQPHIADADGTLADATTKLNTLLSQLETHGINASS